jgi:hypothetical protein
MVAVMTLKNPIKQRFWDFRLQEMLLLPAIYDADTAEAQNCGVP